ncbi:MAG: hypothetical protein AAF500_15415 [Myxococcota bacterium]
MPRHRTHLALTVWPILVLFVLEVSRLWPALGGATAFAAVSPDGWLPLAARSALVFAFFVAYVRGWASLRQTAPSGPGPYRSDGARRLQWWAGAVSWGLVWGHLGLQWFMSLSVGPISLSHYELYRELLSRPFSLGCYAAGLAALGVFASQGLAASFRAMGYAERPETSRWLAPGCILLSAVMLLLAANILSHFVTGRGYLGGSSTTHAQHPTAP